MADALGLKCVFGLEDLCEDCLGWGGKNPYDI